MVAQSAALSGSSVVGQRAAPRADLQVLRASGLAQARLQVAVLAGNRHRALEQIDRLVAIDRELERLAGGGPLPDPQDLAGELADQRLALASEKLALTAEIRLPRLEPAFGAGMAAAIAPDEDVEILEEEAVRSWLVRLFVWGAAVLLLGAGLAIVAMTQA